MDIRKQKITVKEFQQCCIVRGIAKSLEISQFTNNFEHQHVQTKIANNWGINTNIKSRINELYKSGVCRPNTIRYQLREEGYNWPSQRQLYNYLAHLKEKLNGKKQICYGELEIWCKERTKVPENEHEV